MQISPLGSLDNPIISPRESVNVLSVRNNTIVQYINNSEIKGNRVGYKSTLKQNLKTSYTDTLKSLNQKTEFDDFYSINDHVVNMQRVYNNHSKELLNNSLSKIPFCRQIKNKNFSYGYRLKELGTISTNQVKTIKKCVENMISLTLFNSDYTTDIKNKSYCTFVTLTLPSRQVHSDTLIRKCQTRFIENLQKTHNVNHYVWKAETQKNGNIHFHIVIDRFVKWQSIRALWNKQIEKLGYISRYSKGRLRQGFVYQRFINKKGDIKLNPKTKQEQYSAYLKDKENGFNNPNTTDIHSLKGVTNSISYILKYLTKLEPTKRPVIGAVWGASNITKKLTYPKFYESETTYKQLYKLIYSERLRCVLKDDFFSVYSGKVFDIIRKEFRGVWYSMQNHYRTLRRLTKKNYKEFTDKPKIKSICEILNNEILSKRKVFVAPVLEKPKIIKIQYDFLKDLSLL